MPQLYTEPIAGYRTWVMEGDTPEISGVIHRVIWPPGTDAHAECRKHILPSGGLAPGKRRSRHMVPSLKCQCGFWAYNDLHTMKASNSYCWGSVIKSVRGVIIAWGRIQITELGFRAEYARPVGFLRWDERRPQAKEPDFLSDEMLAQREFYNHQLERISDVYQIPLVNTEKELQEIAREVGTPIA